MGPARRRTSPACATMVQRRMHFDLSACVQRPRPVSTTGIICPLFSPGKGRNMRSPVAGIRCYRFSTGGSPNKFGDRAATRSMAGVLRGPMRVSRCVPVDRHIASGAVVASAYVSLRSSASGCAHGQVCCRIFVADFCVLIRYQGRYRGVLCRSRFAHYNEE